jgi:hypothetical protein
MGSVLWRDATQRPKVFEWLGPVDRGALTKWLEAEGIAAPPDLIDLWRVTGGGTLFESEEILVPIAGHERDGSAGEVPSVVSRTAWYRSRGLDARYVIFEEGLFLSALRQPGGAIVTVDGAALAEETEFGSLDEWYRRTLRDAFGDVYGLR